MSYLIPAGVWSSGPLKRPPAAVTSVSLPQHPLEQVRIYLSLLALPDRTAAAELVAALIHQSQGRALETGS